MKIPKTIYNVSYRVLDPLGKTLEVVQQSGRNKNYIRWLVERKIAKKYGKNVTLHQIKVTEEA
jgi:hypothetical protein